MSTVNYVAIVEGNQDEGYSAFFPDLPGCVTAAETMLELPAAARDALSLHLQGMLEDGDVFPRATALEDIKVDPEVKAVGRFPVDVDVEDAPVRVNISLGAQFLKRLDVAAEARGMTRSGFLVEAARLAMEEGSAQALERYIAVSSLLAQTSAANAVGSLTAGTITGDRIAGGGLGPFGTTISMPNCSVRFRQFPRSGRFVVPEHAANMADNYGVAQDPLILGGGWTVVPDLELDKRRK